MGIKKGRALGVGSHLAVVSPASAAVGEKIDRGVAALEEMGYRVTVFPHARQRGPLYYAGTVEERVGDLHAAFADETVDGIVCTRGGWGSAELLPFLDLGLIRGSVKAFVGYSDHTSLHTWMQVAAGLVTFYGPMVAADFSRVDGWDGASWKAALGAAAEWEVGGLRMLREGVAEGVLRGGCLSIYAQSLGTPYGPRLDGEGMVLFLEDVGTKPYQWDRYLVHLRYAGVLERAGGIVFGDMSQNVSAGEMGFLEEVLLHSLRDFRGPVAIGLRSGHVDAPNVTLPLGVRVRLEGGRLTFLEAATI